MELRLVVGGEDPEELMRRRKEAAQIFDMATESLAISVQIWVIDPTPANKNTATAALTTQLRAWQSLQDHMP